LCRDISPAGFDAQLKKDSDILRYSYQLTEHRDERIVNALYGFAVGVDGHVQIVIYFDDESDLQTARAILRSLEETAIS
jgi:hypothetical protein